MAAIAGPAAAQQQIDCERNFTAVDENRDGRVNEQEASAALEKEFQRIDADGSGSISKSEWQNCGDARIHTMMDATASELQAGDHAPMQNGGQSGAQSSAQAGSQSGMQAGDQAASQSGTQPDSETSVESAVNQEGLPRTWIAEGQFSSADQDQDGRVTREEAAKAAEESFSQSDAQLDSQSDSQSGVSPSQEQSAEQTARQSGSRFAMIDRNGDGMISQQEWTNRDEANVESLFDRLDQNDDDSLSQSEFQEARNVPSSGEPVTVWYYYVY